MKSGLIRRDGYIEKIRPFMGNPLIKVITGMRRCGKSKMLELIMEELASQGVPAGDMLLLNLESGSSRGIRTEEDLSAFVGGWASERAGRARIFLDEVQEIEGWERCVRSLPLDYGADVYVTGSDAKLLSGELATMLAGRCIPIRIYPFSFSEVFASLSSEAPTPREEAFERYLEFGGMPALFSIGYGTAPCMEYLDAIFSQIFLRDVIQRHGARDAVLLERIAKYMLSEVGHTFSAKSISGFLESERMRISHPTLNAYTGMISDCFLFERIMRTDLEGKEILRTHEKYYAEDHGIRQSVVGGNLARIDRVYENIVCMELLRRGFSVTVGRTGSGREIDFVADSPGGGREYYQVCYVIADEGTAEREFSPLLEVRDNHPKYVISGDRIDRSADGVIHRNIIDFLLERG
jgi:predicted AAA+ superfamily ATPase